MLLGNRKLCVHDTITMKVFGIITVTPHDDFSGIWDSMNTISIWDSSFFSDDFSGRYVFDGAAYYFLASLLLILVFHIFISSKYRFFSYVSSSSSSSPTDSVSHAKSGISGLVSDEDLKRLIQTLEERDKAIWENVIHKSNNRISYTAKRYRPQDGGPMKYLSVTVFEDCPAERLRDFYMDNDYRKQWDKTVVEHEQLQVDSHTGIEIGRTTKKFPLLTSREYVLAWKLWEGKDTFYCFTKECDHNMVLRQRKYVRVSYFRSGWRIRRGKLFVPGRNACEIKMYHQENAGLNVEMAKLAFSKGIWSYVCKMEKALRNYIAITHRPQGPLLSALNFIQKVPSEFESQTEEDVTVSMGTSSGGKQNKLLRKPSKKLIAKGLLLVGGAFCLSRGHSALGAKVALAYLLTKLNKRGTPLSAEFARLQMAIFLHHLVTKYDFSLIENPDIIRTPLLPFFKPIRMSISVTHRAMGSLKVFKSLLILLCNRFKI